MTMKTKLFSILFALIAGVGMVCASDTEVDGIWYDFDDDAMTATVTYRGSSYSAYNEEYTGDITIPESVTYNAKTYSVTSIGDQAFMSCSSLTSIDIPNSVTSIGGSAFQTCRSLTSVTIGNSVTSIGEQAFVWCSGLTSVTCEAESAPALGNSAFYNVDKSIPLYVPSGSIAAYQAASGWSEFTNIQAIPDAPQPEIVNPIQIGDLYYNLDADNLTAEVTSSDNKYSGLSDVIIPASVSYNNLQFSVTRIGNNAFESCSSLTSVTIPNSVTSIGQQAFFECSNLSAVTIPNSVTSIGGGVFCSCSNLTSIIVETGNSIYDSRDNCNAIIETATNTLIAGCKSTIIPSSVTSIGGSAFYGCSSLTSITIPNSVTNIEDYAFEHCIGLTSVTIGYSVTSIGIQAFYGCSNLLSVTIPNSVTSIGQEAFGACRSLTSVTIGNSVTSIGGSAFNNCSSMTSITCEAESAPELGSYVFYEVDKSIPLYVPSGSITAYQAANGWSEFTNIQAIPSSGGKPLFPGDPGTMTYKLELIAAVIDGDSIAGQAPTGAGGYPAGTEATITARDIPGYEFVQWSDSVTDMTRTIVVNESMTLTALYNHSMIEIPVAANQWNFICLPPLGDRQYTEDMFTYDGLTDVKWGIYNGNRRAEGRSGWETPESFNALQGYILYSTTAGTLKINAYVDDIRQGDSNTISAPLSAYASGHPENANWNFLGNPYSQSFNISAFADAGIESPITVWNGTGYTTYTPGIDDYTLQPFEAFFIQKPEGTGAPEAITFIR